MKLNLIQITKQVRKDILQMAYTAQSAHCGGSLSCVELLTVLYYRILNIDPKKSHAHNRDRLLFSKAHDAKALYAVLAERGFFPKKFLAGYEKNNGCLAGHPIRNCASGVEMSGGSLGHGLPMANGIALAGKMDNRTYRVFAILSDGECDEGSTWEAALFAAHHHLDNIVAVIDCNGLQAYGRTKDVLNLEPLGLKWKDFGWEVREVNGHDVSALEKVLRTIPFRKGKPSLVIAHTIKGFGGVEKYIDQVSSQYKPPTENEYREVIKKLESL
jgi:transketolase